MSRHVRLDPGQVCAKETENGESGVEVECEAEEEGEEEDEGCAPTGGEAA